MTMGNLIRRNKAIPVQAHRRDAPPEQVVIPTPGTGPIPIPPGTFPPGANASGQPSGGTTQNIFYITTPVPPPAPQQAAQPPQEIHYHTVIHHTPRLRAPRGTSFLGLLAVLAGGAACAAGYLPQIAPYAHLLAQAGLVMGGLGWLGAILFRRTGTFIPMLGLILSAMGYGLWMFGGKLPPLPKIDLGNAAQVVHGTGGK
jgi:hypothetical protein